MAATAALLDGNSDKAQLYLKRYAKRCVASRPYFLLSALTLAAQRKLIAARALLERHDLTELRYAAASFAGGRGRLGWLAAQLDVVMGRGRPARAHRAEARAAAPRARPENLALEESSGDPIRHAASNGRRGRRRRRSSAERSISPSSSIQT